MKWRALPALALLLTACAPDVVAPQPAASPSSAAPAVLANVGPLVEAVTQRTPKELLAPRLAEGLTPPTNRWFSGLVFGKAPQPVFPIPLGFALTADGFAFGLPRVAAGASTITGGFVADVTVGLGAARSVVSSSDASVVVLDNLDKDGKLLGRTTIAQGSPFVSFVAETDTTLAIPEGFTPAGDGLAVATIGGMRYALAATRVDGAKVPVSQGQHVTFWPVPEGHDPAELRDRSATVTGSSLSYGADGDRVNTTLAYTVASGQTAIARLPQQASGQQACDLGSYPSIYGELQLCAGDSLMWSAPTVRATAELDLSGLSEDQRGRLTTQLDADIAAVPDFPADTYFGGKALQRTAMLLMIADQLKLDDRAERLAGVLNEQLTKWTDPKGCAERDANCFVYDPKGKGMIGLTPSFGSDEYNDHHFHYGYFLYAAAVLARHDPSVVDRYAPVMNLLAADIGSTGGSAFPDRRAFDAYAGHSWASGTSPFADGNNQESVSESVNAYAGLSLWAQAIGDKALGGEADWMLALEARSSSTDWLEPDLSGFSGYSHKIVPLNWGGKRDYATWFSDEPAAKLGILLLPMSPTSSYLVGDPERIRANVKEATGGNFDQKFGDYIAMYSALAGPKDRELAVRAAESLSDANLDDGMTRTYLLAWLWSAKA